MRSTTMLSNLKNNLLVLSFMLFSVFLSGAIACWIIIGLITLVNTEQRKFMFSNFKKEKYLWILPLFYLLHVAGLLWTVNYNQAGLDLQIKLTLFLLPIILSSYHFDDRLINKVRRYFIGGILVSCALLLIIATRRFLHGAPFTVFFYSELSSALMHPTYFSMYLNAALLFVFHEMLLSTHRRTIWMGAAIMIILFVFIVLLSARTAEATAFVSLFVMVLLYWRKKAGFRFVYPLLMVLGVSVLAQTALLKYSNRFAQVGNAIQTNEVVAEASYNSTTGRLEIWRESVTMLSHYWMVGTGTGDVKDELNKTYHENNFSYGYEKSLNTHNQYLQSFLTLGILGLVLFVLAIKFPWLNPSSYHPLLLILLFIFALNCLTESMLEAQRGAIFFALMISIFGRKIKTLKH